MGHLGYVMSQGYPDAPIKGLAGVFCSLYLKYRDKLFYHKKSANADYLKSEISASLIYPVNTTNTASAYCILSSATSKLTTLPGR